MKKIILVFCFTLIISLASCGTKDSEFVIAMNHFENLESVKMDVLTTVPELDDEVSSVILIEGNKSRIVIYGEDMYNFISDGKYYSLTSFRDRYLPEEIDFKDALGFSFLELTGENDSLSEEDFKLVGEYYEYQLEEDEFSDLKIKIEDNRVTEIVMSLDGIEKMDMVITLSDYNEVSVILPENIVDISLYETAIENIVDSGFDYTLNPFRAEFVRSNTLVTCEMDEVESFCDFEENNETWAFSRFGENFNYRDEAYTTLDDLYSDTQLELPQSDFELIISILDLLYN